MAALGRLIQNVIQIPPTANKNAMQPMPLFMLQPPYLEGPDKGQTCNDMSGKAKQDCLAQQQALKESLDKHARK